MSHISSLGQSVIMMGGGPTAKFFKGVSAELANLWKHKQILSKTFNISFWVFTKKKTRLKKQKETYTLNITIFKLSTAEVNTLKKKKNTFFCQENINHNASLKKRLLAFFWTILKTTFFFTFLYSIPFSWNPITDITLEQHISIRFSLDDYYLYQSRQHDLSGSSLLLEPNPSLSFCVAALGKTIHNLELPSYPDNFSKNTYINTYLIFFSNFATVVYYLEIQL